MRDPALDFAPAPAAPPRPVDAGRAARDRDTADREAALRRAVIARAVACIDRMVARLDRSHERCGRTVCVRSRRCRGAACGREAGRAPRSRPGLR